MQNLPESEIKYKFVCVKPRSLNKDLEKRKLFKRPQAVLQSISVVLNQCTVR
jgi:hypothetical protein